MSKPIAMAYDKIVGELAEVVGIENATNDKAAMLAYSRDQHWPFVPPHLPDYVVRPKSTEEVSGVMKIANAHKIPVVPLSSGINVRGLCIPAKGGIVIDMRRMNKIIEINPEMRTVTIEPGVPVARLSAEVDKYGLRPNVPGSPATVASLSNSMLRGVGLHIAHDGVDQVLSFEIVLPNGDIVKTGSAALPNTGPYFKYFGPDLAGIFMWIPGTLGVVTQATVRLHKVPPVQESVVNTFKDMKDAVEYAHEMMEAEILAAHWTVHWTTSALMRGMIKKREDVRKLVDQFPPWITISIFEGSREKVDYCKKVGQRVLDKYPPYMSIPGTKGIGVDIGVIGPSPPHRIAEYRYGRRITNLLSLGSYYALCWWGPKTKQVDYYNLCVDEWAKLGMDPEDLSYLSSPAFPYHGLSTYTEVNAFYDPTEEKIKNTIIEWSKLIIPKLLDMGIYGWFRPYTDCVRATWPRLQGKYLELYKNIKKAIDPNGIMNPGKLYDE